jgi:prepilin-type N-terminal cleavage/methylation domain-containing protein
VIRLRPTAAFTLVELILVMALLAIVMALSAPSLSRSLRERHLKDEATRFLALTEYGRSEAESLGVPMIVWIDPTTQRYGIEPKAGFEDVDARNRDFTLNPDIHLEFDKAVASGGLVEAIEFSPDGTPTLSSIDAVRLVDRFDSVFTVARTSDGWGYEILKEAK